MPTVDAYQRFDLLRFPLIVGVIFIHNHERVQKLPCDQVESAIVSPTTDFIRILVSESLARVAVPLFFLMSGYLFFLRFQPTFNDYCGKLKSRSRSLLVPFLFWNVATLLLIAFAQALPATQGYFSGKNASIASFTLWDYACAIFGIGRSPIAYQFWFIRDLILLVLASPLIYTAAKYAAIPTIAVVGSAWFFSSWPIFAPSNSATLFFTLGCWYAVSDRNIFMGDAFGLWAACVYLVLSLVDAEYYKTEFGDYIHKAAILAGIPTAFYLTLLVARVPIVQRVLLDLRNASFFVYAVHEPLLSILRKLSNKVVYLSSASATLPMYFLLPIVVLILSLVLYQLTHRIAPRFVATITGGR